MNGNNPVSLAIALSSVWNNFGDFLPKISFVEGDRSSVYEIFARLPEKIHRKLIRKINGKQSFRESVVRKINEIFSHYRFRYQSCIKISWTALGVSFETDGCSIGVSSNPDYGYYSHNITNYKQANILFIALSIYLYKLYPTMEALESKTVDSTGYEPLKEEVVYYIKLKKMNK